MVIEVLSYRIILTLYLYSNSQFFNFAALLTIKILISNNIHIGKVTSESVKTSDVGVMTAATIRIITTACLRYRCIKFADRKPYLVKSHERTYILNTTLN